MNFERTISWFWIDRETLAGEVNVDHIELESLINIFKPRKDDPLMIYPYDINEDIAKRISQYLDLDFEFEKFTYQLDCFQK